MLATEKASSQSLLDGRCGASSHLSSRPFYVADDTLTPLFYTLRCVIILDRNLSRLLAEPLQVIMPLSGSVALPVGADEGSIDWQQ